MFGKLVLQLRNLRNERRGLVLDTGTGGLPRLRFALLGFDLIELVEIGRRYVARKSFVEATKARFEPAAFVGPPASARRRVAGDLPRACPQRG